MHVAKYALCLALSILAGCGTSLVPPSSPHPLVSQNLSPHTELSLDGRSVRVPEQGKVTVIDVWATSCKPCVAMMPAMQALYAKYASRGLVIVGIAADDNPGLVQMRLRELGVSYANIVDAEGTLRGALRVTELPHSFVVDRRGVVRLVRVGGKAGDMDAVESAVETLLAEVGK